MEKKTLLAIALSVMVMLFYARFMNTNYPQSAGEAGGTSMDSRFRGNDTGMRGNDTGMRGNDTGANPLTPTLSPEGRGGLEPEGEPYHNRIITVSSENDNIVENKEVIENEVYKATFTDIGGSLKDISLLEFFGERTGEPIVLAKAEDFSEGMLGVSLGGSLAADPITARFEKAGPFRNAKGEQSLVYTYADPSGIKIEKTYTIPNFNYHIELGVKVTNNSASSYQIKPVINGAARIDRSTRMDDRFLEASCLIDEKPQKINRGRLHKLGTQSVTGEVASALLRNRYYSLLLFSDEMASTGIARSLPGKKISMALAYSPKTLLPGQSATYKYTLYAGPTDLSTIADYKQGLDRAINIGVFGGIGRLFFAALKFFHSKVHNYGVAILLLGLLVSIVLYPFTLRMHRSMKHMQEIQPKVDQLRKELKDNPQRLNKEIMELYRKNKVNPFGGCWPMLFQMPILFSLYPMLLRSIELKNASFLWIKDLSEPDKAFHLPFVIPKLGAHLNILPLLTVVVMFLQQKLTMPKSKASADDQIKQQQKFMALFMPIMIGVIFYNMPSGFVLYWFTYMSISVFHQMRIRKA